MIDSHAHLNYEFNDSAISGICNTFKQSGGKHIIDVSTGLNEFRQSLRIAADYTDLISSVYGIHPERAYTDFINSQEETLRLLSSELEQMITLAAKADTKITGIGETGFDIYRNEISDEITIEIQKQLFTKHIEQAKLNKLPVIIHTRGKDVNDFTAHLLALEIAKQHSPSVTFYFHSFTGDSDLLKKILDTGSYIGINGVITYRGVDIIKDALKYLPHDKLLLETDAPFLIPSNIDRNILQDKSKNEPVGIFSTAKLIAKVINKPVEYVLEIAHENAKRLFSV
jgi:TatD DNase family protein